MIQVMMAAPFDAKGRYRGGVSAVAGGILENRAFLETLGVRLIPFDTCRVQRRTDSAGRLNLENISNFLRMQRDVKAQLRREKPQVFYMHTSVGLALIKDLRVLQKAKKLGCRTVLHIHSGDMQRIFTGKSWLDRRTLSAIKTYADAVVLLSRQTLAQLVDLGIPKEKCHLNYNFVPGTFPAEAPALPQETQPLQFLFAAQIGEQKGIFDALEVLGKLQKPFRFHVCGQFPEEQTKERFCQAARPLGEKLVFHGYVTGEEKSRVFCQADVLLLPSYSEGLPVVILEAYKAGCGIIATDVGAVGEIVGEKNGIVLPAGDSAALKAAVEHYLSMDRETLCRQQEYNQKCAGQYTPERFLNTLAKICREICEL